jgi:5'-3' exonuclease
MIAAGTEVFWTETDYSGRVVRVTKGKALAAPFRITRSDQQEVELLNLKCSSGLRCAPMSGISLTDPGISIEKQQKESTRVHSKGSDVQQGTERSGKDKGALPDHDRHARAADSAGSDKGGSKSPGADRAGHAGGTSCEVLAFDFMNLLVRAWHAGKPSETHAVRSMFQTVASAIRTLKPSRFVFAMDGGHVHRSKLLPQYKAHRPPHDANLIMQRELAEEAIRIAGIPAFRVHNWEADDVLASLVDRCPALVICSSDKDLLALHGRCRIFHPWSGGGFVDPEAKLGLPAGQVADYLALCGDTSDGIPGVKGIGEKTAAALLADHGSLECILAAAAMGKIPGAIGRRLNEQRDAALTCREVVQLRGSLPLPELLPWTPPVGFQQGLQAIGLGSVAGILDGVLSSIGNHQSAIEDHQYTPQRETALSATTAKVEQGGSVGTDGNAERPSVAMHEVQVHEVEPAVDRSHLSVGPGQTPERSTAIRVTRSMSEPIRQGLSWSARWDAEDRGMISCWECGREATDPEKENPWKAETPYWFAWEQGRKGLDLDAFWYPPDFQHPKKEKPPRHDPPPQQRRSAGSLF